MSETSQFHELYQRLLGQPWESELRSLQNRQEIEIDGDSIAPNIAKRNEKFKTDAPILLSAFVGLRRALGAGGFLNEAALRLPMDILLHLVWNESENLCPSYLCVERLCYSFRGV